jgi:hypothetical protein
MFDILPSRLERGSNRSPTRREPGVLQAGRALRVRFLEFGLAGQATYGRRLGAFNLAGSVRILAFVRPGLL